MWTLFNYSPFAVEALGVMTSQERINQHQNRGNSSLTQRLGALTSRSEELLFLQQMNCAEAFEELQKDPEFTLDFESFQGLVKLLETMRTQPTLANTTESPLEQSQTQKVPFIALKEKTFTPLLNKINLFLVHENNPWSFLSIVDDLVNDPVLDAQYLLERQPVKIENTRHPLIKKFKKRKFI